MKPWDPIILAVPGGAVPVAPPIHVTELPEGDMEALWWAHLLAALWGLRSVYQRLGDHGQVYRTGRVQAKALDVVRRIFLSAADRIHREAVQSACQRLQAWDWRTDPLPLETGWWAQAAFCAHALASGYAFSDGGDDLRAILSGDVLRAIRARVECALPEDVARDLLILATSTAWLGAEVARANMPSPGTPPESAAQSLEMEMQG